MSTMRRSVAFLLAAALIGAAELSAATKTYQSLIFSVSFPFARSAVEEIFSVAAFGAFSSAGCAVFSFAGFSAGFSVFAASAAGADPRPAFTSGLIFAIVSAETPARDKSDTEE